MDDSTKAALVTFLKAVGVAVAAIGTAVAVFVAFLQTPPVPPPPPPPAGAVFYVATTGNDSADGSLSTPWKTVGKGVQALTPGATLYIRAGTYVETLADSIPSGTDWSAPVTVSGYTGETAILQGSGASVGVWFVTTHHIVLQNLVIDGGGLSGGNGCVKIDRSSNSVYAHHIRVTSCEIRNYPSGAGAGILMAKGGNSGAEPSHNEILGCTIHNNCGSSSLGHGVYSETNDNLISGCTIYANGGYGIVFYSSNASAGSTTYCSRNVVSGNRIYGQKSRSGIGVCQGTGNLLCNNLCYTNSDGGIYLNTGCAGTSVLNCTVYGNSGGAGTANIQVDNDATTSIVRNCISPNYVNGSGSTTADHNLIGGSPLFVNALGGDFHLQAGSPGIDAGVILTQVPVDFDGVSRPQGAGYDVGSYER